MIKYIYSLIILLAACLVACDRVEFDDLASAEYQYVGVSSQTAPTSVTEGSGASNVVEIPLLYDVSSSSDVDITFTVTGTAELGTHFNVVNAKSTSGNTFTITLPADTFALAVQIETIPNYDESTVGNLTFSAEITDTPADVYPGTPLKSAFTMEIIDDDCPFIAADYNGTVAVEEVDDVFGGGSYTTTITQLSGNTYEVTDYAATVFGPGFSFQFTVDPSDPTNLIIDVPTQTFDAFGDTWEVSDIEGDLVNTCGLQLTVSTNVFDQGGGFDLNINVTSTYTIQE
ncbi:hypothetical protein [Marinoscillum sp.]|uniref:hypothetical protein n=1 Tax=Marinoscillum sp. TaxID=2024838 RepID=UPI003BAD9E80